MKLELEIPDSENGLPYHWEEGFEIKTENQNGVFILIANKDGLISLAIQLLTLAQDKFPSGHHFHYDSYGCLEENSVEMVILKK